MYNFKKKGGRETLLSDKYYLFNQFTIKTSIRLADNPTVF